MSHNRCRCDPPLTLQEHLGGAIQILVRQQMSGYRREENEQAIWQLRQTVALLASRVAEPPSAETSGPTGSIVRRSD